MHFDDIDVRVQGIARVKGGFSLPISVTESNTGAYFELKPNQFVSQDKKLSSAKARITQPYWLEKEHGIGAYAVDSLSKSDWRKIR